MKQGDAIQLTHLFEAGSFDVILCHNTWNMLTIRGLSCGALLTCCEIHPA